MPSASRSALVFPLMACSSPLNTAIGYLRLHRKGYSNEAEIATKMGRTVARVEQLLLLANANSDVHALVKEGRIRRWRHRGCARPR